MSELDNPFKCDGCGRPRISDSNNWISAVEDEDGVQFLMGIIEGAEHYCGIGCGLKRLSGWFHARVTGESVSDQV